MDMQVKGEPLVIEIAGAQVTLQPAAIADLWIEKLTGTAVVEITSGGEGRPAIGTMGEHGIYAGIARGYDGAPDAIIEVLEAVPSKRLSYQEAMKWAESVGGTLPTRKEAALLFANVSELFDANYAYWTCEPYAGNESYAWSQDFYLGYQYYDHKGSELRARAVRRLTLS